MTIEEMKKERDKLKILIQNSIEAFEKTTGVRASSVRSSVLYGQDGSRGWNCDIEVTL